VSLLFPAHILRIGQPLIPAAYMRLTRSAVIGADAVVQGMGRVEGELIGEVAAVREGGADGGSEGSKLGVWRGGCGLGFLHGGSLYGHVSVFI